MKFNLFISLVVAVLLSLVTSKIIYFGFTPYFSDNIFSRKAFNNRFDHGVFKYRILSKYLLFAVDDWLGQDMPEKGVDPRISFDNPDGSDRFYLAFCYLNTFFLVLTSMLVVLLLDLERAFQVTATEKQWIIFFVPILIGLSEFPVCCYDVSSYFFQLLILYVVLKFPGRHYWGAVISIGALIILSTLNRESSALSVSMIALLLVVRYGITRNVIVSIGISAICFLATYFALRWFIVDRSHIHIVNPLAGKFLYDLNIIGLLFWGLFFYLPFAIANTTENRWLIAGFILFSLPYILTCLINGVIWEIRLYIPLFLGALFLSKLDISTHVVRITDIEVLRPPRSEIG